MSQSIQGNATIPTDYWIQRLGQEVTADRVKTLNRAPEQSNLLTLARLQKPMRRWEGNEASTLVVSVVSHKILERFYTAMVRWCSVSYLVHIHIEVLRP